MELQRESLMAAFRHAGIMAMVMGTVGGLGMSSGASSFLSDNFLFATSFAIGSVGFFGAKGYIEAEWEIEARERERPRQKFIYRS